MLQLAGLGTGGVKGLKLDHSFLRRRDSASRCGTLLSCSPPACPITLGLQAATTTLTCIPSQPTCLSSGLQASQPPQEQGGGLKINLSLYSNAGDTGDAGSIPGDGNDYPFQYSSKNTYSSILAWRIPWTEQPGGLQSRGSERVECDLATKQQ